MPISEVGQFNLGSIGSRVKVLHCCRHALLRARDLLDSPDPRYCHGVASFLGSSQQVRGYMSSGTLEWMGMFKTARGAVHASCGFVLSSFKDK